ncbi:RagB/SusD family nutrient uptake outer membrane protein [Parapedobacter indicus]|uniref:Starch-binding associating with outer membrane n=1 Tax=Parapedobacter indicus TaxID=1477437 RepID=A0A1I3TA57_9SPHI|nr:RagB/SusD family nutrient uptake outer membrane protein [Parapedobacter indicus]PPK99618.1 putative outer membrane starch-binding protein [Parapedobacter indicus]SFJ66377.1 Starch-binding associating with outer membrane [Parapedobacter indicus]
MTMTTYLKSLPVAALMLMTGCEKYLDKEPIGILTEEQVQTDPTVGTLTGAVTNAYVPLASTLNLFGDWNWTQGLVVRNDFIVEDIASGDANKKWNPDGDQAWMDDVAAFNFTPENGAFNGLWTYDYEGVSRTNLAISQLTDDAIIQKIGMSSELRNRLLGEASFLRAFYYFNLVTNFGDVPLLLKPLANFNEAYDVARRSTTAEVWAQIDIDLAAAAGLLPNTKYSVDDERWRVSRGAVIALQAKSALYQQRWQDVVDQVTSLEALGYYSLNANYFDAFDTGKEFSENEVIFAYDHQQGVLPRRGNGLTALLGWGFVAPTDDFLNAFEANDPRSAYTVNTSDQAVYKLLGATNTDNKGNDDSPVNRIYIRWADVLLWKAEAYNELGNYPEAIGIINGIRTRARTTPVLGGGMAPAGTLPARNVAVTDKAQVQQWLDHERRVELGFESHRFSDLRRWNTAKAVLTAMGKNFQDRNYLYPIPQGEVDKSAGSIMQNQGY